MTTDRVFAVNYPDPKPPRRSSRPSGGGDRHAAASVKDGDRS